MRGRKVELLAPAGNYDSFIAAINAGADAVYVGGEKFSARAFADNFDTETLCKCIRYAHLFGKRVYLTLNTLIKENEFDEIYDYVKPFYLAGLDGVIIQDLGVLRFLKEHFPQMELHASTQMAVTGAEFVSMCQEWGISRVVPARELSLKELQAIREAGIEVECFIHGAMCYCYSGMCLMSSILGGRSGNRGKCAQPCRLPYRVTPSEDGGRETYTLSLKDMCTIEHIPALIEAGMDSFKIEGRMKRSEYAAGVTALYRKYIDYYYEHPDREFCISRKDRDVLEHLYMRSELHDGYLFKHNGEEMVTKDAPSYSGLDEGVLENIKAKYLGYTQKLPVSMYGYFEVGQESSLTVYTDSGISVTVNGPVVDTAQKAPASVEAVEKQLGKLGNTHFMLRDTQIVIEGDAFLPNGVLNAMRRDALEQLEEAVIGSYFPEVQGRSLSTASVGLSDESGAAKVGESSEDVLRPEAISRGDDNLSVLVTTAGQLGALRKHSIYGKVRTLYLEDEAMQAYLNTDASSPERGVANVDRRESGSTGEEGTDMQVVYAMPYILRARSLAAVKNHLATLYDRGVRSVLVRNVEELALIQKDMGERRFSIITDASMYCWNLEAKRMLAGYAERITLPFELNSKELRKLRGYDTEQIIYGYIPLMITANCIYRTNSSCRITGRGGVGETGDGTFMHPATLRDRYDKNFRVLANCKYCYNTIYNSVPLSLHKKYNKAWQGTYRLQFGIESVEDMKPILDYYEKWIQDIGAEFPVKDYTTAHENRQVE